MIYFKPWFPRTFLSQTEAIGNNYGVVPNTWCRNLFWFPTFLIPLHHDRDHLQKGTFQRGP